MKRSGSRRKISNKKKGRIFVISAPSGCGKTTLCKKLVSMPLGLVYSVSMTTRAPRPGEKDKRDYYFISRKEFLRRRRQRGFLEWAYVFGQYYGTPKRFVEGVLAKGKDVVLSIDVQGALRVKRRIPQAIFIFIIPPSLKALRSRLRARKTDHPREITRRLRLAQWEMSHAKYYDYIVVNDRLDRALNRLKSIVIAEKNRDSALFFSKLHHQK